MFADASRRLCQICKSDVFLGKTARRIGSAKALDLPELPGLSRRPLLLCQAQVNKNLMQLIRNMPRARCSIKELPTIKITFAGAGPPLRIHAATEHVGVRLRRKTNSVDVLKQKLRVLPRTHAAASTLRGEAPRRSFVRLSGATSATTSSMMVCDWLMQYYQVRLEARAGETSPHLIGGPSTET